MMCLRDRSIFWRTQWPFYLLARLVTVLHFGALVIVLRSLRLTRARRFLATACLEGLVVVNEVLSLALCLCLLLLEMSWLAAATAASNRSYCCSYKCCSSSQSVFCKEELKLSPPLSLVCALHQQCLEVLKHGGIHLMIESINFYMVSEPGTGKVGLLGGTTSAVARHRDVELPTDQRRRQQQ
jgi:hypothetical protein